MLFGNDLELSPKDAGFLKDSGIAAAPSANHEIVCARIGLVVNFTATLLDPISAPSRRAGEESSRKTKMPVHELDFRGWEIKRQFNQSCARSLRLARIASRFPQELQKFCFLFLRDNSVGVNPLEPRRDLLAGEARSYLRVGLEPSVQVVDFVFQQNAVLDQPSADGEQFFEFLFVHAMERLFIAQIRWLPVVRARNSALLSRVP